MKIRNVMLFSYDFPHKKTQDFLLRLLVENYNIQYVIAAPWKKLNMPASTVRIAPNNVGLIQPRDICKRFHIKYLASDHNSKDTISYIKKHPVDLYIISGARILSKQVIEAANNKIVNIHPALLPDVRGMDPILWTVYLDLPLGISAHFIDATIDGGRLIYKEKLGIKKDDTLIDVSLRLLEKQPDVLSQALKIIKERSFHSFKKLSSSKNTYNKKMPSVYEKKSIARFSSWIIKYGKGKR